MFALQTNSNDALVGLLTVAALLAATLAPGRRRASAAARGIAIGLGAAAKFAPLLLAPLFATAGTERGRPGRRGAILLFAAAMALTLAAVFAPFVPDGGPRELYDRTIGYQAARGSPFSVWGQADLPAALRDAVKGAVVLLAMLVAFVPRSRSTPQTAALAAAVLIAVQLTVTHWFYLYVVWFAPLALLALFAPYEPLPRSRPLQTPSPDREARTRADARPAAA
jgi:MFS family permease